MNTYGNIVVGSNVLNIHIMAGNKNEGSQQQGQGVVIGQSNDDITMPQGAKGPQELKERGKESDRTIPNQERSSAANEEKSNRNE
jgi:hypothetical protein